MDSLASSIRPFGATARLMSYMQAPYDQKFQRSLSLHLDECDKRVVLCLLEVFARLWLIEEEIIQKMGDQFSLRDRESRLIQSISDCGIPIVPCRLWRSFVKISRGHDAEIQIAWMFFQIMLLYAQSHFYLLGIRLGHDPLEAEVLQDFNDPNDPENPSARLRLRIRKPLEASLVGEK